MIRLRVIGRGGGSAALLGAGLLGAALLLAACSDGTPASDPSPSATRTPRLTASTAASYPRAAVSTVVGDPVTLDVCSVAVSTDLQGAAPVRLEAPASADAAACTLTSRPQSGGTSSTISVRVQNTAPTAGYFGGAPTASPLAGSTLYSFPPVTDATGATACARAVALLPRAGRATTWVAISNDGNPAGSTTPQSCAADNRIAARFAALAVPPVAHPQLTLSTPSLLALDTCKVVSAGRVGAAIDATGTPTATAFGAGCSLTVASGSVEIVTGSVIGTASPAGSARTVDGHRLLLQPSAAPNCAVLSRQGDATVTARFAGSGESAPADCGVAATALSAYLDAVKLT